MNTKYVIKWFDDSTGKWKATMTKTTDAAAIKYAEKLAEDTGLRTRVFVVQG